MTRAEAEQPLVLVTRMSEIEKMRRVATWVHEAKIKLDLEEAMIGNVKSSPTQIWVRDRRKAARHEAGHVVVAHRLGLVSWAHIYQSIDPQPHEKFWIGRTYVPDVSHHSRFERCTIAVAGAVAEIAAYDFDTASFYPDELLCDPYSMSPSDWKWAECEPGWPDENVLASG
jgi:hypothetical protein